MEYHAIQTKSKTGCGDVDGLQRFSRMAYNVLMRLLCSLEVLEDCWWLVEEKWVEWVRSVCSLVSNKHSLVFTRNISALISQKKHENEDDDVAHMDGMHVAIVNLSIKTLRQKYKKDLRPISSILVDEKKSHKLFSWVCRAPHFGKKTRTMTNGSRSCFLRRADGWERKLLSTSWNATGMDSHGPQ